MQQILKTANQIIIYLYLFSPVIVNIIYLCNNSWPGTILYTINFIILGLGSKYNYNMSLILATIGHNVILLIYCGIVSFIITQIYAFLILILWNYRVHPLTYYSYRLSN
jgi:hypothetical protein